jgi:hypothetical protein
MSNAEDLGNSALKDKTCSYLHENMNIFSCFEKKTPNLYKC